MGYTTEFSGQFDLDKPLTPEHAAFLRAFADTRRMKRDMALAHAQPDPIREAAGVGIGADGGHFVGATVDHGQGHSPDILDYNNPPEGQPGLWCLWIPTDDLKGIEWDQGEKFYEYVTWLEYIIEHFLKPWGYVLSGSVEFQGEQFDDRGLIVVQDNDVGTTEATYEDDVCTCPSCGYEGPPKQFQTD